MVDAPHASPEAVPPEGRPRGPEGAESALSALETRTGSLLQRLNRMLQEARLQQAQDGPDAERWRELGDHCARLRQELFARFAQRDPAFVQSERLAFQEKVARIA